MFWVYILQNPDGKFYIGQTENLERRIIEHNSSDTELFKFTHKNGPWKLIWSEQYNTRSETMNREKFIKSRKSSKWIMEFLLNR